jgi:sarcosine oxidase, subunit beta
VDSADVVVIGGGITGLCSGYWMAKRGLKVVVVEKGLIAWEASGRNHGMMSPRGDEPREIPLAIEADRLWPMLDEELGHPTEWVAAGRLWAAMDEADWLRMQETGRRWAAVGVPIDVLDRRQLEDYLPGVSPRAPGGLYSPRGGHGNPHRTAQAFAWAMQARGGRILQNTRVLSIVVTGGRVSAVETTAGTISAPMVVSAAGPQTGHIGRMVGIDVPVAPARVEAMLTTPLPPLFEEGLVMNGLALRQSLRGNLVIAGGPHEWTEVEADGQPAKPSTLLMRDVARRLVEAFPGTGEVPLLRAWAGIVELTPDKGILLDRLTTPSGMVVASASGHGFGLCPSIGKAISELVIDGVSTVPIDGLNLARFGNLDPDWRASQGWKSGAYNT